MSSIKCPICEDNLDLFTHVHMKKHGLTRRRFLKMYPQYDFAEFWGEPTTIYQKVRRREKKEAANEV